MAPMADTSSPSLARSIDVPAAVPATVKRIRSSRARPCPLGTSVTGRPSTSTICIPSETTFDMQLFDSIFEPDETAAQGLLAIVKNRHCVEIAFDPDGFAELLTKFVGNLCPDQMLGQLNRYQILTGYTSKLSFHRTLGCIRHWHRRDPETFRGNTDSHVSFFSVLARLRNSSR